MGEKLNFLILSNSQSAESFAEDFIGAGCSYVATAPLAKVLLLENSKELKS